MRKTLVTMGALVLSASLASSQSAPAPTPPAESELVKGTWTLNNWTARDAVRMTLSYRKGSTRWTWSSSQELADLKGLSEEQLHAMSTPATFALDRDPGVFFFKGTIVLGVGRGEYAFAPNPSFAARLAALGYGPVESDDASLMIMAVRDVTIEYAAEVKRLGLKDLAVSDLVRFLDHGIDIGFIRDLVGAGYPGLTGEDVVRLRDHGVDGRYVARIQSSGFKDVTVDQIVKLHDHGVD